MTKVDIVSGFLGSGKTTFSNKLLRYYMKQGLRPVFIVNEFGQTGLDADIIKAGGFEAVEIDGGCICCTLKNDIASTIIEVVDKFSPTNIVFEPSGIFIFDNFIDILKQPEVKSRCEIGEVFTIVDSVNYKLSAAHFGSFIYNQIKNASIIILSKLERASYSVEEIICDIKNINPDAFILSKKWSELQKSDFEILLNKPNHKALSHHSHVHGNIDSFTISPSFVFSKSDLDNFIYSCLSGAFGKLYRVKGLISSEKDAILINIALEDVVLKETRAISEPSLTFIGEEINEENIARFLKSELRP